MRNRPRHLIALCVMTLLAVACGQADTEGDSSSSPTSGTSAPTSITSAAPPLVTTTVTSSTTTTTSAGPDPETDPVDLTWNDDCERVLVDHLEFVGSLVAAYEHLSPEQYLVAAGADETSESNAAELDERVDELGCSETYGTIAALARLDTVAHSSPFGQFIKVFSPSPFSDGWRDDIYEYVDLVSPYTPPTNLPTLPPWTEPTTCTEAWDRDIELTDVGSAYLAYDPTAAGGDEISTLVLARHELIVAAGERLGCDFFAQVRYRLDVAASRTANDFWQALAKSQLVASSRFVIGEPFVPPLYPETVARDLDEPARSLLQPGTLDEMIARLTTVEIDHPADYLQVSDIPSEEIGGVVLAIPRTHVPVALASDADYELLAEYNEGLAEWARDNSGVPDGFFSDRLVVFVAYHRDHDPFDVVQVEILPRAWSEEEIDAFFRETQTLATPAGELYWDDIEQDADRNFSGHDILLITYLLPVPELNVTYSLDCSTTLPVRDGFSAECEQIARTFYPVGRIVPSPPG